MTFKEEAIARLGRIARHPGDRVAFRRLLILLGLDAALPPTPATWNAITERVAKKLKESLS